MLAVNTLSCNLPSPLTAEHGQCCLHLQTLARTTKQDTYTAQAQQLSVTIVQDINRT
jgi:hypothetical protein